ncbi:MAG: putative modified peptide [Lysobacter sp.]|nr:putative modified peptide [Lysobacter sp.]
MATKKTGARSAPLDPKVADKLLDLLSTDNAFRRLFKKDPQAALAQVGHPEAKAVLAGLKKGMAAPARTTASCCQVASIAPKATIVRTREELKTMLTSGLMYTPPQLDAAIGANSPLRRK